MKRPMTLKLGTQYWVLEYYQVCSNDPGLTLPILGQGQIWSLMLLYGEKGKTMDFSKTIVVYDMKVRRCGQLNKYMNIYEF